MENAQPSESEDEPSTPLSAASPVKAVDGAMLAERIESAETLAQKALLLWSLPAIERHAALGGVSAQTIAALIESNPAENTALLGNLPARKFNEIINLGAPDQGRKWLERAVSSKMLAAEMLPALMSSHDLMLMLMTSREYRSALGGLLNFRRAEEMRSLLHPLEWKQNLDDLLLADAEELLRKAPIRERSLRAILQSVLDFFPELYLQVIRQSVEYAKYREDHAEELLEMTDAPFAMPEFLTEDPARAATNDSEAPMEHRTPTATGADGSVTELIPTSGDPFLRLATAALPVDRRDQLEAELKDLLRREILATGSFSHADLLRAAGRLLFQIRSGLYQIGGTSPESASQALRTRSFSDIVLIGARVAERYRQRALQLAGVRDWLDRTQRQFLTAMNTLEPGVDPETGEPVLYLPTRAGQPREDWQPMPVSEVDERINDALGWAGLARAAFGAPARVQTLFAGMKTKTSREAIRRTIVALCLYRRWEPELVNPADDFSQFKRSFGDQFGRLDKARTVVLEALDHSDPSGWRPAEAKDRARALLLAEIERMELGTRSTRRAQHVAPPDSASESDAPQD
jgi:hypothetical protein